MSTQTELKPETLLETINQHSVGNAFESLDSPAYCLHCNQRINLRNVRVNHSEMPPGLTLGCPTEKCDGSPIDWYDKPWWK